MTFSSDCNCIADRGIESSQSILKSAWINKWKIRFDHSWVVLLEGADSVSFAGVWISSIVECAANQCDRWWFFASLLVMVGDGVSEVTDEQMADESAVL